MAGSFSISMHRRKETQITSSLGFNSTFSYLSESQNASSLFDSSKTSASSSSLLASERWSIEKRRQEWDRELAEFRKKQCQKMKYIKLTSGWYYIIQ